MNLAEIEKDLIDWLEQERQPMKIINSNDRILLCGEFELRHDGQIFDKFDLRVYFQDGYPYRQPLLFEDGGRVPKTGDCHVYVNGSCCVGVWEEWLLTTECHLPRDYLEGPARNFFLAQLEFERSKEWPFGQRSHNLKGILESYSSILGIEENEKKVIEWLDLLSHAWKKGHWICPCDKHQLIRHCGCGKIISLSQKVPPSFAKMMKTKLLSFGADCGKKF